VVQALPVRTLVFHALWLALAAYGVWLLRRRGPAPAAPPAPAGAGWWLALAAVLALSLALRLHDLGQRSLWLDEAISLWLARRPWGDLLPTLATHDESPPLYFALLHLWRAGGENEPALRLLSVLASVLAVAFGAALGTALGGRGAGLLAALALAVSPVQVHHAQEARMYAQVSALTLGVTWGALRLCAPPARRAGAAPGRRRGGAPPLWPAAAWGAALAALAATHHTAALAGAGAALGVLLVLLAGWRPRLAGALATAGVVGAVLWLPVAPVLLAQSRLVAAHYWIPRPTPPYVLSVLLDAGLGSLPLARHVQISDPLVLQRPADAIPAVLALPRLEPWRQASLLVADAGPQVLLFAAAFLLVGLAAARRRLGLPGLLVPSLVVAFPVFALLLVSQVRPLLLARTLVGSGAVVLVLLAVATTALPRPARPPAALALLTVLLLGLGQYWWYPAVEEWRPAAAHLAAQARPGDLVLINGRWTQLPLDYYLSQTAAGLRLEERGVPLDFGDRGKPEPVMTEDDLPRLRRLTAGRDRAWLVLSHSFDTDPRGLTRSALEAEFPCFEVWRYQGVALHLFTRC
jgi:uncharacterized membrane protein